MSVIENIKRFGKQISLKIVFEDGTMFEKNDIKSCVKSFTGDMLKSIMTYVEVELTGNIDVKGIFFEIDFGRP